LLSLTNPNPQRVPNYLVLSIVVTIFCCVPTGIAAIVYSAQVNTKLALGDYEGAVASSEKARFWGILSFALCAVPLLAILVADWFGIRP